MNKPNNYEAVTVGEFKPVELGGHYAVIKKLEETTSKSGKPMVKIAIDFDKKDKQPEYFMEQFKNDIRPEKKWPFNAVQYILSEDEKGDCSRSFKSFIRAFEESNNCTIKWGKDFDKQFQGKKIGVVFGENEEEYNGEVKTRRRIRYFCNYDLADSQLVPEKKLLPDRPKLSEPSAENGFMPMTDAEEIPF